MVWQHVAIFTFLALQSRSKKLVQSKVMETSVLVDGIQITHDLACRYVCACVCVWVRVGHRVRCKSVVLGCFSVIAPDGAVT